MAGPSKKHTMHIPKAKSAPWKVFEFAIGPGLMLAVLIALGAHLIINDQALGKATLTATHGR
ncbi:hypothetical protein [Dongia deserti]|uniref:hypothetical protein n=1 Tax=Dongia deserti TaxID=2268030 RepID=UPI0013C4A614|nr:hypothetical protein [Dongia deserti]